MLCNKNLKPIATELLIRGRISFVFITQSYFAVAEDIILNFMDYFLMEIPNTIELKQFASQNWSDIDFQDFLILYKKCTAKSYSFLVIDNSLALDSFLRFRNILLETI